MGLWIVIIKFWQPGLGLTRLSLSGWDLRAETRDRLPPLCRGRLLTFNLIFVPEPTSGAPEHPVLGDNWWIPVEIIFRRSPPSSILPSTPSSRARYAVTELGVRAQFVKPGQISIHNRDLTSIGRKSGLTKSEQIPFLQTCVQQCQAQHIPFWWFWYNQKVLRFLAAKTQLNKS